MQTEFIKGKLNFRFGRDISPRVKNGFMVLENNTSATATVDGASYHSDLKLSTQFTFTGREKRVDTARSWTNWDGYNETYMDVNGVYDPGLALTEFARHSKERRVVKEDTYSILTRQVQEDSHEAFIYNMLISWLKAQLKQFNADTEEVLKVVTVPYDDSHVTIDIGNGFSKVTHEIELGLPVDQNDIAKANWYIREVAPGTRATENYWKREFVLHYDGSSPQKTAFYLAHVLGRTKVSQLNFDVPIAPLDTDLLALDPIGGEDLATDFDIPWDKPELFWSWIIDYVRLNRLESAFAATLELLGSVAVQPAWSTQEACLWARSQLVIVLPTFSPTRARIRTNLEGSPYRTSAGSTEFTMTEARSPKTFLLTSALSNYYQYLGLYAVLFNEARSMTDWHQVYTSQAGILRELVSCEAKAACISVATGMEYATCMHEGCGMYIDISPMSVTKANLAYKPKGGYDYIGYEGKWLPAPVTGSLVLGTCSGEMEALAHLQGHIQVKFQGAIGQMYDTDVTYKTATIYRLFGHDVEFERYPTNDTVAAVVPSKECVPDVGSIMFDPSDPVTLKIGRNVSRDHGHSYVLPNLFTLAHGEKTLTCTIQTPMIEVYDDEERKVRCAPTVLLTKVKRPINYKIKSAYVAKPSVFLATRLTKMPTQFTPKLPAPDLVVPATKPRQPGTTLLSDVQKVGKEETPVEPDLPVPPDRL
jgi:hypothetical protein